MKLSSNLISFLRNWSPYTILFCLKILISLRSKRLNVACQPEQHTVNVWGLGIKFFVFLTKELDAIE
jgi:hypothetical protein